MLEAIHIFAVSTYETDCLSERQRRHHGDWSKVKQLGAIGIDRASNSGLNRIVMQEKVSNDYNI